MSMQKKASANKSSESSADWVKRILARLKGWYQVFSIETGGETWRDDLLMWESRVGRERTEAALTEAHYRASDFNHFTASLVIACIPPASGRQPDKDCSLCGGNGMKPKYPGDWSVVTKCDCLQRPVEDFKGKAAGE